jgi:hypothetical protein
MLRHPGWRVLLAAGILFFSSGPFQTQAADNAFTITHSRFEPLRGGAAQIHFSLPEAGFTNVTIFNLRSEPVRILFSAYAQAGDYQLVWDGENSAGTLVAAGAYVIRITAVTFTQTRKVVVIK